MIRTLTNLANNSKFQIAFVFLFVGFISAFKYFVQSEWYSYTSYNNFMIFKHSFYHLIGEKDLYELYDKEHFDYFKYSPTFALFMGLIAFLPTFIGLCIWNFLNVFVLF